MRPPAPACCVHVVLPDLSTACTVNCRSVEKLRTLHIAWLHRKVMVEDFRTQYAFFNGLAIDCISAGLYRIAGNFGGSKFWRIGELSPKLDTPKSFYCTKSWSLSAQAAKIKFAKT